MLYTVDDAAQKLKSELNLEVFRTHRAALVVAVEMWEYAGPSVTILYYTKRKIL